MELKDVIGPGYPCKNCGLNKVSHFNNIRCRSGFTNYTPERIDLILDLQSFKDSPLEDIANRLKAM